MIRHWCRGRFHLWILWSVVILPEGKTDVNSITVPVFLSNQMIACRSFNVFHCGFCSSVPNSSLRRMRLWRPRVVHWLLQRIHFSSLLLVPLWRGKGRSSLCCKRKLNWWWTAWSRLFCKMSILLLLSALLLEVDGQYSRHTRQECAHVSFYVPMVINGSDHTARNGLMSCASAGHSSVGQLWKDCERKSLLDANAICHRVEQSRMCEQVYWSISFSWMQWTARWMSSGAAVLWWVRSFLLSILASGPVWTLSCRFLCAQCLALTVTRSWVQPRILFSKLFCRIRLRGNFFKLFNWVDALVVV